MYNALFPFVVAVLEGFLHSTFCVLLAYSENVLPQLRAQNRKVTAEELADVAQGRRTVVGIVADWYTFQNLRSAGTAYQDWVGIDLLAQWRCRKRVGCRMPVVMDALQELIDFRHRVVHRCEVDHGADFEQLIDAAELCAVAITLVVSEIDRYLGGGVAGGREGTAGVLDDLLKLVALRRHESQ